MGGMPLMRRAESHPRMRWSPLLVGNSVVERLLSNSSTFVRLESKGKSLLGQDWPDNASRTIAVIRARRAFSSGASLREVIILFVQFVDGQSLSISFIRLDQKSGRGCW
jgi:hypothetical protein